MLLIYTKQIKLILKLIMISILFSFSYNLSYAATVDAWSNQTISAWESVNLSWTESWFESCMEVLYRWSVTTWPASMTVNPDYFLVWSYITSDQTMTEWDYTVTLDATWRYCWTGYIDIPESDTMTVTIWSSTPSPSSWTSRSEKMREEAKYKFVNPESIKLELFEENINDKYFYYLRWNNIWGEWEIDYEIQYSTWSSFKNYVTNTIKTSSKAFVKYELGDSPIYFFRVKAKYKEKKSSWSNTLSIMNKDDLLKDFKIICLDCDKKVNFQDIFETVNLLIEKEFNIKCTECIKPVKFDDIWQIDDYIFDKLDIKCIDCDKKLNYDDSLREPNDTDTCGFDNIKCDSVKKIDFSDLIK